MGAILALTTLHTGRERAALTGFPECCYGGDLSVAVLLSDAMHTVQLRGKNQKDHLASEVNNPEHNCTHFSFHSAGKVEYSPGFSANFFFISSGKTSV